MLLAAPVFRGDTLKTWLRIVMILSGALCVVGLLWLAVSPPQAILIGILGWGAAGPIAFLLSQRCSDALGPRQGRRSRRERAVTG